MAGTINRMPIEKMKAEFDAKGATYGKTISKKIKPYINKVCETLADTSIFHAKQRQEVNTIKQQLGIPQPLTKQYELWEKLFRIQFLLNFEDSYQCARHCEELALQLANSPKANSKPLQPKVLTTIWHKPTSTRPKHLPIAGTSERRRRLWQRLLPELARKISESTIS